jgi:hypothetical protein
MSVEGSELGTGSQPKFSDKASDPNLVWHGKVGAFKAEVREEPERGDSVTLVVFGESGEILVNQPVTKPGPDDDELKREISIKRAGIRALDSKFYRESGLTKILKA